MDSSAILMPSIIELLAEEAVDLKQLDLISVGIGPGSFTGVRTSVVTARALALALNKPLMGINTLEAIAANYETGVAVIINAYKNYVFMGIYNNYKPLTQPVCITLAEISTYLGNLACPIDLIVIDDSLLSAIGKLNFNFSPINLASLNIASCQMRVIYHKLIDDSDANLLTKFDFHKVLPLYLKEASVTLKN